MVWEAIRLDRAPSAEQAREAFAAVLEVAGEAIDVGKHLEKLRPHATVMIAIRPEEGDFSCTLDVVAKDEALGRPLDHEAIAALCARWSCRALVADDSDNPYCFLLVTADAPPQSIVVDETALDERNALVVLRPATDADRRASPAGPVSQRRPTPPPPDSEA